MAKIETQLGRAGKKEIDRYISAVNAHRLKIIGRATVTKTVGNADLPGSIRHPQCIVARLVGSSRVVVIRAVKRARSRDVRAWHTGTLRVMYRACDGSRGFLHNKGDVRNVQSVGDIEDQSRRHPVVSRPVKRNRHVPNAPKDSQVEAAIRGSCGLSRIGRPVSHSRKQCYSSLWRARIIRNAPSQVGSDVRGNKVDLDSLVGSQRHVCTLDRITGQQWIGTVRTETPGGAAQNTQTIVAIGVRHGGTLV